MRSAGVLLPVSALMSEYGIGDFGSNARFFLDFVKEIGFKIWQVLPITTVGAGNSPYSSVSAFAGNYMFIDVTAIGEHLLPAHEYNQYKVLSPYKVEYHYARINKKKMIKIAFSRLDEKEREEYRVFAEQEKSWIYDYAMYMAIQDYVEKNFPNEQKHDWTSWEKQLRDRDKNKLQQFFEANKDEVEYYYYEQYLFFKQWRELKCYANDIGIEIFGDMPIYVGLYSSDVWANRELFDLDKNALPLKVAGVPPDYFAKDGQLWGNPIYDYNKMKKNDYEWFVDRIIHNLRFYDILRIDHFRGLCEYWAVPAGSETAKEGEWEKGPGMELWKALEKKIKNPKIVAEDLGIIDDKVEKFLCESGYPGMRVFHFAFSGNKKNLHLPYNYSKNTVAYSATHDNDTTLGWLHSLDHYSREEVLKYLDLSIYDSWGAGGKNSVAVRKIARMLFSSSANTVIMPLQDLCAYGSDTRINIPGVAEGNWEYRATLSALDDIDTEYYRHLLNVYGRM